MMPRLVPRVRKIDKYPVDAAGRHEMLHQIEHIVANHSDVFQIQSCYLSQRMTDTGQMNFHTQKVNLRISFGHIGERAAIAKTDFHPDRRRCVETGLHINALFIRLDSVLLIDRELSWPIDSRFLVSYFVRNFTDTSGASANG